MLIPRQSASQLKCRIYCTESCLDGCRRSFSRSFCSVLFCPAKMPLVLFALLFCHHAKMPRRAGVKRFAGHVMTRHFLSQLSFRNREVRTKASHGMAADGAAGGGIGMASSQKYV